MLREMRIQNLGVIDDAVVELSAGLNVLTGETGAGKTMVVFGLGLLLGARADAGLVRAGATGAFVEGVLEVPADHPAALRALEAGADIGALADDGTAELILARSVSDQGRSRAHVGGRTTPVGVLAEMGQLLVAVHGQADQWRLRQPEQHRVVLDRFAGEDVGVPLARYQELYAEHERLDAELGRLHGLARDRVREVAILRAGLEEIESVDPRPDEDVQLREEDERLAHADGLLAAAAQAQALLSGETGGAGEGGDSDFGGFAGAGGTSAGVSDRLAASRAALAPMTNHDPALADLHQRLAELGYLAADLSTDLAGYLAGIDVDPARLAAVQQRRADLSRLQRSFGDSIADVLAWGKQAASRVDELEGAEDRAEQVQQRLETVRSALGDAAVTLSAAREHAGGRLAADVTAELAHLAMGKAVVSVAVTRRADEAGVRLPGAPDRVRLARHGADDVEIQLAANPGVPARSVAKAASGGELSRVMLALEVVTGGGDVPTFVFDEVDAGVGGRAALDIGARLAALAATAQVVVVTHLAQVAAYADRHLVVRKADDGQVTSSGVRGVSGEERIREVARMMAGVEDSPAAMEHARELLEQAASGSARRRGSVARNVAP